MFVSWPILALQSCFFLPSRENEAPVMSAVADVTLAVNEPLQITLVATDPDGDALAFTLAEGPTMATITGDQLVWVPTDADVGINAFAISVTDAGDPPLADAVSFFVTVTGPDGVVNQAPVAMPVEPQSMVAGELLTLDLEATDPDGDALTWTAAAMPPNAALTPEGVFTFAPTADQVGQFAVTATVTDDGGPPLSDTVDLTIDVVGPQPFDIAVNGVFALDPLTPLPSGLCAELLDPTPTLQGMPANLVDTATVGPDGTFEFTDVSIRPLLGFLLSIDDCNGTDELGIATMTSIPADLYVGTATGPVVSVDAFGLSTNGLLAMGVSAGTVGYTGDLTQGGFIMGYTLSSTSPIVIAEGTVVSCGGCTDFEVWYGDIYVVDGLFSTGYSVNTTTTAWGLFVIPDAEVQTYEATGSLEFDDLVMGGLPGSALVVTWVGQTP